MKKTLKVIFNLDIILMLLNMAEELIDSTALMEKNFMAIVF